MIKIGITGSLASGKSTVAKMISSGKYPLYSADRAVKKIYQTNVFQTKVFKKFKLKNKKNIKNKIKTKSAKINFIEYERKISKIFNAKIKIKNFFPLFFFVNLIICFLTKG